MLDFINFFKYGILLIFDVPLLTTSHLFIVLKCYGKGCDYISVINSLPDQQRLILRV
mgnify:CR=1 FL=1